MIGVCVCGRPTVTHHGETWHLLNDRRGTPCMALQAHRSPVQTNVRSIRPTGWPPYSVFTAPAQDPA